MVRRIELQRPHEPIGDQARAQSTLEREARREVGRQRNSSENVEEPGAFGEHAAQSNHAHAGDHDQAARKRRGC